MESASVLLEESRNNSLLYGNQLGINLNTSLEDTFKKSGSAMRISANDEIPFDRDFETPRLPMEPVKKQPTRENTEEEESEILNIADNFLSGPLMARLLNRDSDSFASSIDSLPNYTKSQPVPPLDLLSSSDVSIGPPFNKRWEDATKHIGKCEVDKLQ